MIGPPGTGKSEVIVSLVLSIVFAGKSVLIAAKNHQAINEIEHRLRKRLPDTPLLVRASDPTGEARVSFIDMMKEIATAKEARPTTSAFLSSGRTLASLSLLVPKSSAVGMWPFFQAAEPFTSMTVTFLASMAALSSLMLMSGNSPAYADAATTDAAMSARNFFILRF